MTRFVVEEGGKRRAFKVGEGVITIGSGEKAMLKLASAGVAELHAEIEVHAGVIKLRAKPGVVPPQVGGRPAAAETVLAAGATIQIGEARITVEPPEGASTAAPAATASAPAAPAPGARTPKSAIPAGKPLEREKQAWERSTRELHKDKGLKPVHVLIIAIPLAILGFFLFKKAWQAPPAQSLSAPQQLFQAERNVTAGMWDQAESDLAKILDIAALSTEQQARVQDIRTKIAEGRKNSEIIAANSAGDSYLQTQLKNYDEQRLQGKVDKAAVRVFLKRIAEFERRWPQHPEMDWVTRKKERYAPMVDLSKPPTFGELEFEVKALTWDNPRNYRDAFAIVNRWLESAESGERGSGLALLDKLIKDRDEWFTDRMLEAAHQFKKGQLGQSVQWLAILITYSGDQAMADKAAEQLIKFHGVEAPGGGAVDLRRELRGYRRGLPEYWPHMERNRVLAEWMREHPLDG